MWGYGYLLIKSNFVKVFLKIDVCGMVWGG